MFHLVYIPFILRFIHISCTVYWVYVPCSAYGVLSILRTVYTQYTEFRKGGLSESNRVSVVKL